MLRRCVGEGYRGVFVATVWEFSRRESTFDHVWMPRSAILIAHLKLSPAELREILMTMSTERLEPSHIKQLLLYAPDDEEVKQFKNYDQDPAKLSEPDQFVLQVLLSRRKDVFF